MQDASGVSDGTVVVWKLVIVGVGGLVLLIALAVCFVLARRKYRRTRSFGISGTGTGSTIRTDLSVSSRGTLGTVGTSSTGDGEASRQVVNFGSDIMKQMLKSDSTSSKSQGSLKQRVAVSKDAPIVTFLSHGKAEGGASARLMKLMLNHLLVAQANKDNCDEQDVPLNIFLDSDNLVSLSELMKNIRQTMTLTALLTRSLFYRPWCVCEIWTAATSGTPFLPVEIIGSGFDTTPQNVSELVDTRINASGMKVIAANCPNFTKDRYKQILANILKSPRLKFTGTASVCIQWSECFECAKAIQQLVESDPERPRLEWRSMPFRILARRPQFMSSRSFGETSDETPLAYLVYDKSCTEQHENVCVAHILQLMMEDWLGTDGGTIFIDSERFMTDAFQIDMAKKAFNMVILLTNNILCSPWVIVLMHHASRAGARLVPVQVEQVFDFAKYTNPNFYRNLKDNFDSDAAEVFGNYNISWSDVAMVFRILFDIISCPFHPHASDNIQFAQAHQIMGRLQQKKGDLAGHLTWCESFKVGTFKETGSYKSTDGDYDEENPQRISSARVSLRSVNSFQESYHLEEDRNLDSGGLLAEPDEEPGDDTLNPGNKIFQDPLTQPSEVIVDAVIAPQPSTACFAGFWRPCTSDPFPSNCCSGVPDPEAPPLVQASSPTSYLGEKDRRVSFSQTQDMHLLHYGSESSQPANPQNSQEPTVSDAPINPYVKMSL